MTLNGVMPSTRAISAVAELFVENTEKLAPKTMRTITYNKLQYTSTIRIND